MRLTDGFAITEVNGALTAFVLAILSVIAIYLFYRTVYPPQSNWVKIFLRSSRLIILIIISIQIAMLAVHYVTRWEKQTVVGILVDASKSMEEYDELPFIEIHGKVDQLSSLITEKVNLKSYLFDSALKDFNPYLCTDGTFNAVVYARS